MYCTDRFLLSIITVCDVQEIPLFTFVEDQSLITGRISSQILTRTGSSDERQVWLRFLSLSAYFPFYLLSLSTHVLVCIINVTATF